MMARTNHTGLQSDAGADPGAAGLTYPANLAPLICLASMVLGVALLGYFLVRDRARIAETRRVLTEETPAERESA